MCNGVPESGVLIKLYDDDRGLDFDDFMGETVTDSRGFFEITGRNAEVTPIDPKINIYHDCNDGWWPCQRKISIMIPDDYIAIGNAPTKLYDVGTIELAGEYNGETHIITKKYLSLNKFPLFIPSIYGAAGGLVGRTQSAGAKGYLMCNGVPESGVLIKLYDDDRGNNLTYISTKRKQQTNKY
ncbi:hypothetical protein WUBG_16516 [Wuchereria bancrofti]|uniref:Transthyretin-like family protein n=1 Tax=Wuchereria bancrofti TaxID=6293 RepID=J9E6J2_WUCBA|nr:hypothetical protein WUBG_16516 [Wuchereria bancrofti]